MKETLLFAAMGTGFTFLMTTLGASIVFFIKREIEQKLQRAFLGFAAGVMLAASLWSLLIPATEGAQEAGQIGWLASCFSSKAAWRPFSIWTGYPCTETAQQKDRKK